jgi:hypothetical protein
VAAVSIAALSMMAAPGCVPESDARQLQTPADESDGDLRPGVRHPLTIVVRTDPSAGRTSVLVIFPFGSGDEGSVPRGVTHLAEHGIIHWSRGTGDHPAVDELSSLDAINVNGQTRNGTMHLIAGGDHASTPRLLWLASMWLHRELLYGEREFKIELDAIDNEYVQQPDLARSYVPPYGEAAETFARRWHKTTTGASRAEARSLRPEEVEQHIERLRALDGIIVQIRSPHDADTLTDSIRSIFPDARIVASADDDGSTRRHAAADRIPESALAAAPTFAVLAAQDAASTSAAGPNVERITRFIDLDQTRLPPLHWRLALNCAFAAEQVCETRDSCEVVRTPSPVASVATVAAGTGVVTIEFSPSTPLSAAVTRLDSGTVNAQRVLACINDEWSKSRAELDFAERLQVRAPSRHGSAAVTEQRFAKGDTPATLEGVVEMLVRLGDLDVLRDRSSHDVQPSTPPPSGARASTTPNEPTGAP